MVRLATLTIPQLVYGVGCLETVGAEARRLGAGRVLLVSDRGVQAAGLVDEAEKWLAAEGLDVAVYAEAEPEPSVDSVRRAAEFAATTACQVVIGLGGGSVLDTAKTVAMLLGNGGEVQDYMGAEKIPHKGRPLILLPTTAGTGSEMGRGALFYVPARRAKESLFSRHLLADVAIIDPALTLSMPPAVTAATGTDALCHAVESYTGTHATPLTEPFSAEALRLTGAHLLRAFADGRDVAAREGMAQASVWAGVAIANAGTHAVHALAYPLQGLKRVAHGVANAVLLPWVMEVILPGNLTKFAQVAAWLGYPTAGLSLQEAAAGSVQAVRQLLKGLGLPIRLRDLGIEEGMLSELVTGATQITRLLKHSPCPLSAPEIEQIYRNAL